MRGPNATAAIMPAALTPPATLACPLVSALDRWVSEGVQPAALRWFGSPVAEIKQISAYSCREHGRRRHLAYFRARLRQCARRRRLSRSPTAARSRCKDGWHGSPEEQGFLHDVQLYACETFTTVLSPGYNAAHYNHIHVDLMRRESGRHPCRPDAIPGEVAAAKARSIYAGKQRGPAYTGSIATKARGKEPVAVPGEDGYVADDERRVDRIDFAKPGTNRNVAVPGADGEFDDVTGSSPRRGWPRVTGAAAAGDAAIRAEERRSKAR